MFELSLSSSQLMSALFLQELVETQALQQFELTAASMLSPQLLKGAQPAQISAQQNADGTEQKLVVFTEGLQLQQLLQVQHSLQNHLNFASWNVVKVAGLKGFACAAHVQQTDKSELHAILESLAEQLCLELCLVAHKPSLSEPGLLVMDMDSTVIACECIDEIAALAGVGAEVAAVTAQAMQGKLDFAQSLRTRVACLANADHAILQQVRDALPLMPGVVSLLTLLKQYNWKLAIASGGFTFFADYLAQRLELDAAVANKLAIVDGKLSGEVEGDIVDAQVKAQTLLHLAEKWAIPHNQTIAMGDGANDLAMMKVAALGVALHAKPIVRQQADISIRRGGLDSLLWILAA